MDREQNESMNAYLAFMEQCDAGAGQRDASGVIRVAILLPVYTLGILLQFASFPACVQLAKQRSAFLLLLQINISDTILLFYYIWIYIEFLFGRTISVPFHLHSYPYRTAMVATIHLSVILALNRAIAVIMPFIYQKIFSIRRMTLISIILWFYAAIESFVLNWNPWLRIFHCVYKYPSITEPYTEIAGIKVDSFQNVLFILKNNILRLVVFLIYTISTLWLAFKRLSGENILHNQNGNSNDSADDSLFLNLMQERIRIYMICLIGVLPTFIIFVQGSFSQLALLFYTEEYVEKILKDPTTQNILIGHYQIWAAIYIVQQPILMLALSTDFRKEFRKTYGKYIGHSNIPSSSMMYSSNAG